MIKINKAAAYLIGFLLTFIIYFTGQLLFFIHTEKVPGKICDIYGYNPSSGGYSGRYTYFYVCYTTKKNENIRIKAGTNYKYDYEDSVTVIYKINNPRRARIKKFSALWLVPFLPYLIVWAIIMAAITGAYYGSSYVVIYKNPFKITIE